MRTAAWIIVASLAHVPAWAADESFYKEKPGSMNGFLAARDPVYVKECGACHFPYSPGLLPARSWALHMERLGKHFGETVQLDEATRRSVQAYLTSNAADVSPYAGSRTYMERIDPSSTPYRFRDIFWFRTMHRIVLEVIGTKPRVKVRKLTNCGDCHQYADEGSFGLSELAIPGLTGPQDKR
jgi:hypothetical protein